MSSMDYVITLTDYSAGTVTLTSAPFALYGYAQSIADRDTPTVTETVEVRITDGTSADNLAEMRAVNDMLRLARDAQRNDTLPRVYMTWKESASADEWRSEVTGGMAGLRDGSLSRAYWENDTQIIPVIVERVNYWEHSTEAQLPLSNTNATDNTSGLTVYNCNDGAGTAPTDRVNWVGAAGTAILGDLPSPLRLEITNNYNNATGASIIYAGMLTYGDLANFAPVLEAEAATGGTPSADASASGGNISTAAIATSGDVLLWTWTISAAAAQALAGRTYKLIARFVSGSFTDAWFYPYIYHSSVSPLRPGAMVRPSDYYARLLRDLGAMQLPPWLGGVGSAGSIDLRLYGKRAVESALSIGLDFLFLMPTDGYREYSITGALAYQSALVDDGPQERVYTQDASAENRRGDVTVTGDPIKVIPGRDARIYFLHHANAGNEAPIDRTLSIKAFYRARRLTL